MKEKRISNLKDIAEKLGISVASVSYAFSRPKQISDTLRKKIFAECKKYGYLGPDATAKRNRVNRSRIIAVVLPGRLTGVNVDPVTSMFLGGVFEKLQEEGHLPLLVKLEELLKDGKNLSLAYKGDGLIFYGLNFQEEKLTFRPKYENIVTVDFQWNGYSSVTVDNFEAARKIADYALSHKPERLAILGLKLSDSRLVKKIESDNDLSLLTPVSHQRLLGYYSAVKANSFHPENISTWHIPLNLPSFSRQAAMQALNRNPRPDLMLCMSDCIAESALKAAMKMGLRVPGDLMITGFDGVTSLPENLPSLTTMDQLIHEKGKAAAECILGLRTERDIVINARLIEGQSCPAIENNQKN